MTYVVYLKTKASPFLRCPINYDCPPAANLILSYREDYGEFSMWRCCDDHIPNTSREAVRVTLRFFIKCFKKSKNRNVQDDRLNEKFLLELLENELSKARDPKKL